MKFINQNLKMKLIMKQQLQKIDKNIIYTASYVTKMLNIANRIQLNIVYETVFSINKL
jgi:hypothetical protein